MIFNQSIISNYEKSQFCIKIVVTSQTSSIVCTGQPPLERPVGHKIPNRTSTTSRVSRRGTVRQDATTTHTKPIPNSPRSRRGPLTCKNWNFVPKLFAAWMCRPVTNLQVLSWLFKSVCRMYVNLQTFPYSHWKALKPRASRLYFSQAFLMNQAIKLNES